MPFGFPTRLTGFKVECDEERVEGLIAVAVVVAEQNHGLVDDDGRAGETELRFKMTEALSPELLAGEVETDGAGISKHGDHMRAVGDRSGSRVSRQGRGDFGIVI